MQDRPLFRRLAFSLLFAAGSAGHVFAISCSVAKPHEPTPAEKAFLKADYAQAEKLYREALAAKPGDPALTSGLVRALLKQQRADDALAEANQALAKAPQDAQLMTALAEVQYRQGLIPESNQTALKAYKADPCSPRVHLLDGRLLRLRSMYASATKETSLAHALDPYDPDILRAWIGTLPLARRLEETEKYLASDAGHDADDRQQAQEYLDALKKRKAGAPHHCQLISTANSTEIPFQPLLADATHLQAWGLDVKLNGRSSRLEIDTGASGIYVSRSVAQHAGLKPVEKAESFGIGDKGPQSGYYAYADSIRIGALEFKDCLVEVSDQRNIVDTEGLIGTDVFSRFLVSVDYPMRKLVLSPLPPRPGEAGPSTSLATSQDDDEDGEPSATASSGQAGAPKPPAGPQDRYIAPEMKSWTPVYRVGHQLIVPTMLNEKVAKLFILDTGAFATSISPQAAREVARVSRDYDIRVQGISGKVENVFTTGKIRIRFANIAQMNEGMVSFDTSRISKSSELEVSGFLGSTVLRVLTVRIDYRDGLVDFEYDAKRGYNNWSR